MPKYFNTRVIMRMGLLREVTNLTVCKENRHKKAATRASAFINSVIQIIRKQGNRGTANGQKRKLERRKESSLERGYIERLEIEVNANIAAYQTAIQLAEKTDRLYRDYFDFLHDPTVASPGESELLTVLCRVGIQSRPRFDNTVYDELVSTGRLDIIEYIELTRSLKTYWTVQASRSQGTAQLAPVNRQTFSKLEEFIFWQPALPGGDNNNCLFDFEKFRANNKAASLIAQAQRIQYFYYFTYQEILSKLTEVREALNRGYPNIVETAIEDAVEPS